MPRLGGEYPGPVLSNGKGYNNSVQPVRSCAKLVVPVRGYAKPAPLLRSYVELALPVGSYTAPVLLMRSYMKMVLPVRSFAKLAWLVRSGAAEDDGYTQAGDRKVVGEPYGML